MYAVQWVQYSETKVETTRLRCEKIVARQIQNSSQSVQRYSQSRAWCLAFTNCVGSLVIGVGVGVILVGCLTTILNIDDAESWIMFVDCCLSGGYTAFMVANLNQNPTKRPAVARWLPALLRQGVMFLIGINGGSHRERWLLPSESCT